MTRVRTKIIGNEHYVKVTDIRSAINDDKLIMMAAAMLKVSHDKGDTPLDTMRFAIAEFLTQATGVLSYLDN